MVAMFLLKMIIGKFSHFSINPIKKRKIRTCNHILHETKIAKQWTGFPLHAIAIARNGCGDYLIFLPQKHDPHTLSDLVHIWFHGTNEIQPVDLDFKTLV